MSNVCVLLKLMAVSRFQTIPVLQLSVLCCIMCLCYCQAPVWTTPHRALSTELGQQLHELSDILCRLLYGALACCELYALLEGEEGGGSSLTSHQV